MEENQVIEIDIPSAPIEIKKLPSNWQRVVTLLATPAHFLCEEPQSMNQAYAALLWLHRVYTLEALTKLEWDNKLKLHTPHGYRDSYKPLAEFWRRVVVACDRLQNIYPYHQNSAEWFAILFTERALEGLGQNKGKKFDTVRLQAENKALSTYPGVNPFDQNISPATHFFVNCLLEQSERSQKFKSEVFRPLLRARMNLVKEIRTDKILSLWLEGDEVYFTRPGTKRSRQKLTLKK